MKKVEAEKLWIKVRRELLDEIEGMIPPDNRLPSEEELAVQMGISRATVREALHALIKEGYVTKRHGKGNFGHPSVINLRHRVDLSADFNVLFKSENAPVTCEVLKRKICPADSKTADALVLKGAVNTEKTPIKTYRQEWLYSVNDQKLAFCIITIPENLIHSGLPDESKPDLENWMLTNCGLDIAYFSTTLRGGRKAAAAGPLGLKPTDYLQIWDETVFDIHDRPVCFIEVFFHPENAELNMAMKLK